MRRNKHTELGAVRRLMLKGCTVTGKHIGTPHPDDQGDRPMGNGSWGTVDYLVNHCGYNYTVQRVNRRRS